MKASPGIFPDASEVALLGGVQINRYGGDRFQPLFFQTLSSSGKASPNLPTRLHPSPNSNPSPSPSPSPSPTKATDMYKSTFGLLPELTDVLGDAAAAQRMLVGSLG